MVVALLAACGSTSTESVDSLTEESSLGWFASSADWAEVAVGSQHACGLRQDGTVQCWGCADVPGEEGAFPEACQPPTGMYRNIECGVQDCCALGLTDGLPVCWGSILAAPPARSMTQLSCDNYTCCGVLENGSVECWDMFDSGIEPFADLGTIRQVDAGTSDSACVVTDGGAAVCRTYDGDAWNLADEGVDWVAAGPWQNGCVLQDGAVWCTDGFELAGASAVIVEGETDVCALGLAGDVTCSGTQQDPDGAFVDVGAWAELACGVMEDGRLLCWDGEDKWGAHLPP